ncbi:hypothetical protein FNO01nite_21660 [Flavobacterium noncentrifugens]|uniref:Outer membrane protein beta-barrel domain-containing protein n=2 Tax=Flavobacterium noncentrifugens TaxID=1128970 RepID=A0A1G9AN91_9FLAO|nr:hypothetical protein FNO01nite_21660 [Flavobacterium noncentrifugens]SDK28015.1 hypothetical protein SAMN04487935_2951 [Flavobacterium noncentrifugens]
MLFLSTFAFAQTQNPTQPVTQIPATETKAEKQINLTLEGMIGISVGDGIVGINVGGPSLKLKIKDFKIGVGAFPSLIIMDKKAVPRLAVSPIVEYKKWMLITPYYGYDSKDKMLWTFGIGYKFR